MQTLPADDHDLLLKLELSDQIAKLARSQLPLHRRLVRSLSRSNAAQQAPISDQVAIGLPLAQILAHDRSPQSHVLAACIEAGVFSQRQSLLLRRWMEVQLDNMRNARSLRTSMAYPCILILIMLTSICGLFWMLIPEYQKMYVVSSLPTPWWIDSLEQARAYLPSVIIAISLLAIAPFVIWMVRSNGRNRDGQPRLYGHRLRLQSLAADVASAMLANQASMDAVLRVSVVASGANAAAAARSSELLNTTRLVPALGKELSLLLVALQHGVMDAPKVCEHLEQLSINWRSQANFWMQSRIRWFPMLVAMVVGGITICSYVLLVYLPWILLLKQITSTE